MIISIVVAASENGVIGRDGDMPWRMPSDLKRFRRLTMGKPVVMGRKTFQSLPKALDGRTNIVVTRDVSFNAPGAIVAHDLDAALALARADAAARGVAEVMIIGGGEIYAAARAVASRIYLTRIGATLEGDTCFPTPDGKVWRIAEEEFIPRGDKDDHDARAFVFERRQTD